MTENNAAQTGLTTEQILSLERRGNMTDDEALRFGRAIESALLSKLRAEGVQAGDGRPLIEKLEAWQAVCDRIVDQYGGVVAGVDFAALGRANRAALASAPVADDKCPTCNGHGMVGGLTPHSGYDAEPCPDCAPVAGEAQPVGRVRHFNYSGVARNGFSQEAVLNDDAPSLPDGTLLYAAPQASEAVRNQALDDAEEAVVTLYESDDPVYLPDIALAIRALKTQADKDGGDCAKGAGDVELLALMERAAREAGGSQWVAEGFESLTSGAAFYGGLIMNADGETIVAQCVNEPNASHMMSSSPANVLWLIRQYRAALSPTPSVVKQSLTATQTGEKGESDA